MNYFKCEIFKGFFFIKISKFRNIELFELTGSQYVALIRTHNHKSWIGLSNRKVLNAIASCIIARTHISRWIEIKKTG